MLKQYLEKYRIYFPGVAAGMGSGCLLGFYFSTGKLPIWSAACFALIAIGASLGKHWTSLSCQSPNESLADGQM
jgi:hypothetical protein